MNSDISDFEKICNTYSMRNRKSDYVLIEKTRFPFVIRILYAITVFGIFFSFFDISRSLYIQVLIGILNLSISFLISFKYQRNWFSVIGNISVIFLLILIYAVASVFWALNQQQALIYGAQIFIAFSYSLSFYILFKCSPKYNFSILKIFLIPVTIHNIIAWIEIVTHKHYFTSNNTQSLYYFESNNIPLSFFWNGNDLAIYLLWSVCLLAAMILITKAYCGGGVKKVFLFVLLISSISLLIITRARSIWILLAVTIVILSLLYLKNTILKYIVVFTSTLLSIVVILYNIFSTNNIQIILSDESYNQRLNLARNAFLIIKDHLIFGVGGGNGKSYQEAFLFPFPTYGVYDLHNFWLDFLSSYGLFIFMIFSLLYLNIIYKGLILALKNRKIRNILLVTWLVIFIFASTVSSSIFNQSWVWVVNVYCMNSILFAYRKGA